MGYKYGSIKEAIDGEGIVAKYKELSVESVELMTAIVNITNVKEKADNGVELSSTDETILEGFNGLISDICDGTSFLHAVMLKRLKAVRISTIPDQMLLLIDVFELTSPGEVVLLLISLMDIHDKLNDGSKGLTDLTLLDVAMHYSHGFYSKETVTSIIDNILKPKLCKNSGIY